MNENNFYLHMAKFLLENKEVAKTLATAIDVALESLDAHILRELDRYLDVAPNNGKSLEYKDNLIKLKNYWISKYLHEISWAAGIRTYHPSVSSVSNLEGFIKEFTCISTDVTNNYLPSEWDQLLSEHYQKEEVESYYNEKAYHEFTASGGCRD